ncbi:hypothetical protein [Candidatus Azobacteroides pseudotrichonymphae]|jgi:hypothetical protein|uniref:Uncharacterized protein n=1 Tax=Azobacteroides pseudotrichonymphae genomovar. CFP2 TaxID=511995 RepID=B6YSB2_AZOPC|nr:hypothetical protein [Candidatus Azobacteroides pseudotrichonymphae]BAG84084.1 hypothetical protein CFPG_P2-26 [Candidatus Azobacteroides pseudotrichonymphae genomovar. CFP2]
MKYKIFLMLFPILTIIASTVPCEGQNKLVKSLSKLMEQRKIYGWDFEEKISLLDGEGIKNEIVAIAKEWNTLTHDLLHWFDKRNELTESTVKVIDKIDNREILYYRNNEISDIFNRRKALDKELDSFPLRKDEIRNRQIIVECALERHPSLQNFISSESRDNLSKEIQNYKNIIISIKSGNGPSILYYENIEKEFDKKVNLLARTTLQN